MTFPTPEDYRSETPPPRIIGTEWETAIDTSDFAKYGSEYANPKDVRKVTEHDLSPGHKKMAVNGACPHSDGTKLEYASPECLGPRQAALAQHAGYYFVHGLVTSYDNRHRPSPQEIEIIAQEQRKPGKEYNSRLFLHTATTNPDGKIASLGNHDNCQTALSPEEIYKGDAPGQWLLNTYDATRTWDGAGLLTPNGYQLLQKASDVGRGWTRSISNRITSHDKPMGIINNKEYIDVDTIMETDIGLCFTRGENRVNDIHFDLEQTFLRIATYSLILRILEQRNRIGDSWSKLSVVKPVQTLHEVSADLTCKNTYECVDGKRRSALDIGENLATIALNMISDKKVQLPEDEVMAANLWLQAIDGLRNSNIPKGEFDPRIRNYDFAKRLTYLIQKTGRGPSELTSNINFHRALSLAWDTVNEKRLDAYSNSRPHIGSLEEIKHLVKHAPEGTRAKIREEICTKYAEKLVSLTWQTAAFKRVPGHDNIVAFDPYETKFDPSILED